MRAALDLGGRGGGISRLLWTSMTRKEGHRTGGGAQGWKPLTPHSWGPWSAPPGLQVACLLPAHTLKTNRRSAHTEPVPACSFPIQGEGEMETDGARREETPGSCPFLSPSPFPDVSRPPRIASPFFQKCGEITWEHEIFESIIIILIV